MERHRPGKKAELKNALVAIGVVIFFAVFLTGRSFGTVDLSLTSRRFTQRRGLLSELIDEGEASGNITDGEDCPIPQNATQEFKCHFVNATDGCQPEGLFNYLVLYYCQVSSTADPAILAFYIFWLIVLFITLGSTAEDFFCPSLTFISKKLKLKPRLAGVTLLAFGNGAPDVFSVLAAVQQKQPGLALGELTGSGVFVTTVVVGAVSLASGKSGIKARGMFLRDVTYYLVCASTVFAIFLQGTMTIWYALLFIGLYVVYVVFVVIGVRIPPLLARDREPWQVRQLKQQEMKRVAKQRKQMEKEKRKAAKMGAGVEVPSDLIVEPKPNGKRNLQKEGNDSIAPININAADNNDKGSSKKKVTINAATPLISSETRGKKASRQTEYDSRPQEVDSVPQSDASVISADDSNGSSALRGRLSRTYSRDTFARRNSMVFFSKIGALTRRFSIHRVNSLSKLAGARTRSKSQVINALFPLTNVKESEKHVEKGFWGHLAHAIGWDEKGVISRILFVIESPILLLRVVSIPIIFDQDNDEDAEIKETVAEAKTNEPAHNAGKTSEESSEVECSQTRNCTGAQDGLNQCSQEVKETVASPSTCSCSSAVPTDDDRFWNHVFQRTIAVANPFCFFAFFGFYVLQLVSTPALTVGSTSVPVWLFIALPGVPLSVASFFLTRGNASLPQWMRSLFVAMSFLNSIAWIDLLASELVALLEALGYILDIDHVILGLTVLAWGNSLGDLLADVAVARQGFPSMAITACYGCPLFNMMLGLGISFVIACVGQLPHPIPVSLDVHLFISFLCLGGILVTTLLSTLFLRFQLPRPFGAVLLCLYATFTVLGILAYVEGWTMPEGIQK